MLVGWVRERFQVSCVCACRPARFSRAAYYRASRKPDQSGLRERMRQKLIKKAGEELLEKLEVRVNNWL